MYAFSYEKYEIADERKHSFSFPLLDAYPVGGFMHKADAFIYYGVKRFGSRGNIAAFRMLSRSR